jgi:1-acyl-sn-glycerol-3-phosphate acyltransferase
LVIPFQAPRPAWQEPRSPEAPASEERLRAPHLRVVPPPREIHPLLAGRDDAAIRRVYPWLARLTDDYFGAEVEGVDNLSDRASLVVSTHNGSWVMPDLLTLLVAFWRRFGMETPAYGLGHRMLFQVPAVGGWAKKIGGIDASWKSARVVLSEGYPLLVCPGGDADALKPFSRRHQINFGRQRGFVRLAIEQQVPIIPVVSVGAHEVFFVLTDGRKLAQWSGAARFLRLKSIPLALAFPVGLTPGGLGAIPLPSRVRVRVLRKIELDEPPEAAQDDAVVERCFERVRATMQRQLDDLASHRRWPVLG